MPLIFYLFFLLCVSSAVEASEIKDEKKKICLNMIVKDESSIIKRCLTSVKPIIDYWIIVDTGSKDETKTIIKEFMKDIPGELHERSWQNFEHNRNQALELAAGKADYILFMDADEILEFSSGFKMPELKVDSYDSLIHDAGSQYNRILLIKDGLDWKWHGVLHEYIASSKARNNAILQGIKKVSNREGARSADPQKYQKDAQILEKALQEDANNERYVFYLAQSYRDAGDYASALKNYEKRVKMGGYWDQEIFYAMLQIGRMQELLKMSPETIIKSYYTAFQYRPTRAEPLFYLAKYYRDQKNFEKAYQIATIGMTIPLTQDILIVEKWIYDYDMQMEISISSYWIGKYEESQQHSKQLLAKPNLSQNVRETVEKNLGFANAKILEKLQLVP
jgi:glycosyltransferase involved in cell wall biosynthesis